MVLDTASIRRGLLNWYHKSKRDLPWAFGAPIILMPIWDRGTSGQARLFVVHYGI
jgi:hypothetical protein